MSAREVRRAIREGRPSQADWALAVGVSSSNICRLVAGAPSLQEGPLMQRLVRLLADLESGRARWVRLPPLRVHGRPRYVLESGVSYGPLRSMRVDFGRMELTV